MTDRLRPRRPHLFGDARSTYNAANPGAWSRYSCPGCVDRRNLGDRYDAWKAEQDAAEGEQAGKSRYAFWLRHGFDPLEDNEPTGQTEDF